MYQILEPKILSLLGRLTIQQIADRVGVSRSGLRRYMKRQGLRQDPKFVHSMRRRASAIGGKAFGDLSRLPRSERLAKYRRRNANLPKSYQSKRRALNKKRCVERMGGKCRCGYGKCRSALHILHPDGRVLSPKGHSDWEKFVREMDVYELVCSNCLAEKRSCAVIEGSIEPVKTKSV
jgi:hypothetical protein